MRSVYCVHVCVVLVCLQISAEDSPFLLSPTPIDLSFLEHASSNLGNMFAFAHVYVRVCACVWWRKGDVSETFVCASFEFLVPGTLHLFVRLFIVRLGFEKGRSDIIIMYTFGHAC